MIIANPSTNEQSPIGVFDSGVGGLSVLRHLVALMPNERYIYYADTKNVPYGDKSSEEILFLTLQAVDWLCKQGCKLIVIACNSASAHALSALRERCSVPIVGLVPAVKPACQLSQTKQIAVLATKATLHGRLLGEVIDTAATPNGITVHKHFEPRLVPWVESGMPIDHHVADLLIDQARQWYDDGIDVIVLGCTHYPFFKAFLQAWIDKNALSMTLIDSGEAIALRVRSLLELFNTRQSAAVPPSPVHFYASQFHNSVAQTASRLAKLPLVFVDSEFKTIDQ